MLSSNSLTNLSDQNGRGNRSNSMDIDDPITPVNGQGSNGNIIALKKNKSISNYNHLKSKFLFIII